MKNEGFKHAPLGPTNTYVVISHLISKIIISQVHLSYYNCCTFYFRFKISKKKLYLWFDLKGNELPKMTILWDMLVEMKKQFALTQALISKDFLWKFAIILESIKVDHISTHLRLIKHHWLECHRTFEMMMLSTWCW